VPWKALRHPNVLPLLGVIMTETKFAMVSEWMSNGNINQFVTAHQDANRFDLVSSQFEPLQSSPVVDDCVVPIVVRRRKGLDLHARSKNGPR
jgi:serine/threonine protein kinase